MVNEETYRQLIEMKLCSMAAMLREYMERIPGDNLSFAERFGIFVDREWSARQERRLKYRLTMAKLREQACIEDINYHHPRGLDRSVMERLSTCQWVKNKENILLTGSTGVGKTWIACALAHQACRVGYTVLYERVSRILAEMTIAHGDGSYPNMMERLAKPEVLVLDDFGLTPLQDIERRDFLEVIEDRQGRRSTIVVSQLQIKHWHEVIGEPTIADAVMDRLISSSHQIEMRGDSMRARKGKRQET